MVGPLDQSTFEAPGGEHWAFRHLLIPTRTRLPAARLIGPSVLAYVEDEDVNRGGVGPWYYSNGTQWIPLAGAGMGPYVWDYLVDNLWAAEVTAGRGTEGQVFTTFHGHTFKVYSTVQAAITDGQAVFSRAFSIFVVGHGVSYQESIDVPSFSHEVHILGSGRDNTIIGFNTPSHTIGNVQVHLKNLTLAAGAFQKALSQKAATSNMNIKAWDCIFRAPMAGDHAGSEFHKCNLEQGWVPDAGDTPETVSFFGGETSQPFDFVSDSVQMGQFKFVGFRLQGINAKLTLYRVVNSLIDVIGGTGTNVHQSITVSEGLRLTTIKGQFKSPSGALPVMHFTLSAGLSHDGNKIICTFENATSSIAAGRFIKQDGAGVAEGWHVDISCSQDGVGDFLEDNGGISVEMDNAKGCKFTLTPADVAKVLVNAGSANVLNAGVIDGASVGIVDASNQDHGLLTGLADNDHPQYILGSILSAKGSLISATGAGLEADLPVGADTFILVADSAEATGVKWAAPSAATSHDLLSATHPDTLAAGVTDGSIIIANVTPAWSELVIAIPAVNVRNVLGVDNAELRPSWKTALDATNPADIAAAASPGTSLVFAHRDHAHAHPSGLGADLHHTEIHDIASHSDEQEAIEDIAGALVANVTGTHTGIDITYQDVTGDIDFILDVTEVDAVPTDIGTANAIGAGTSFVNDLHVHNHPSGLGATLHHSNANDHPQNHASRHADGGADTLNGLVLGNVAAVDFDDISAGSDTIRVRSNAGRLDVLNEAAFEARDIRGRSLYSQEQAAAQGDLTGVGQFWVKDDTPNIPRFTDDAGTDFDIATAGGAFHDGFSDFVAGEHLLVGAIDHDLLLNFLAAEHFTEASIDHGSIGGLADDDHAQYHLSAGDTGTGVHDFGGATSFEIPNSATPVVDADGEIAVDTTVADFSHGLLKYFGGEEMGVVAMPIAQFTAPGADEVAVYDAAADEFQLKAASSQHTYVFIPDAAFNADVVTGDAQGVHHHSGDATETVVAWYIDFETAPTGATIIIQLEYADTDDLDTAAVWTEIDREALPISAGSVKFTGGFTNATIPANRLIRMNIDQIGSTAAGQNGAVHLLVERPMQVA